MTFTALLKKEILEIYRTRKFMILGILFLFVAISSPVLAKLIPKLLANTEFPGTNIHIQIPDATWKDSIDQFVKNLIQFGVIVIVFMFAGSIAEEKNKKTLELVLAKPVPRNQFVLSKVLSSFAVIKVTFLASAIIFYLYTLSLFGSLLQVS